MKFGVFYEHQLPRPWLPGDEARLFHEALEQVVLADKLGFDYAWEVEHHFLDEYSHSSAPEVFLAAAAGMTKNIRLGHGIRQVIANYNHPARTAECLATLDIVSHGRVDFGIGEGATRLELGGFHIPAKEKRAMCLEAAEQIANMMVLEPYPGFEGASFSMPCRNVLPKPMQKPHPPMWMACTNRDTIKVAASKGVGALAFSFIDPDEARVWSQIYYDIIASDQCVPIGHTVNANIAMVSNFSIHHDRAAAIRRGNEGFEFFGYALNALVAHDTVPGRTNLWPEYLARRGDRTQDLITASELAGYRASGIGTPDDMREHLRAFQASGIDQVIFMQQAGRNRHDHICQSLELFAAEVMAEFKADVAEREAAKAARLAPHIEAALARKIWMQPLADDDIPVVRASVAKAQINQ
ncbi:alkanesulfonate monooxygenase SsuD/methylene tetrahydromethanopterin reductase-like flavin-dependent oxidoreductase (luciferase family) [Caulobacter ginsengisoli]|uniref:Alkanesulfonate monooxygenase SsuD/methylene tetrahydromethanopterin reductase-like flavin-dependent oxidoreductase (Luciferase family) n=1 Tax=Caulobacter ginsengisoli TaxID=400775 RepID=A0ABU0INZ1_9CAUL|nr:LLM class flavin-dependent oxidoreductase [Caulobacter ginsengisoli]MDQ0463716.1 alkanesulfonate monooxygenase SsuD/methylene tetrahydromethanopterin reductase-like flavin-dependent oxidoreductase (luciferase family) [Caulobacter ginsengisoli]